MIDDQDLSALLKQIDVPPDLPARLGSIPDTSAGVVLRRKHPPLRVAPLLAIAATIAGLALFRPWAQTTDVIPNAVTLIPPARDANAPASSAPAAESTARILDGLQADLAFIDHAIRDSEIQSLLIELERIRSQHPFSPPNREQRVSLIASLATESAVNLGANIDWAKTEMARIIQTYPNTRGAGIAQNFIALQKTP